MKFQAEAQIPNGFTEYQSKKVEKYGLDIIITPEELETACEGDPLCEQALSEMLTYAIRYASDVWSMKIFASQNTELDTKEWQEQHEKIDRERSQLHDTYLDSIRILSRHMVRAEKNIDWMKKLAPVGQLNRATCGNFAIMLTYWLSVNRSSYGS
jgi:hypothetical protein